ncbi:demethylmenaquinone methyltransferase [Sulfoacidibacillus thermotolerans]|uniref:Demethylmenaquinone methyltransferase n=1 Tax=Sulfoacidibacillus thermotolerans TaxID=1765684 RepID=A0A2U3DCR4_SULT2|nr:demethylmenaquinone methyltransferase [Sulfoacidibacillus thermotolerans]PWI59074.1 bifunctional demethylmenaquinone methyltransferase/2-methoxy-6-polyprenyl-1,4-benzoquinol methylase [Sulfoacidibacillus thermotolerans]
MAENNSHVRSEFVHDVFSHIAGRYDVMNSVLSFNQHKLWRKFTMRKMAVKKGAHCLDLATGTADWAIALAEQIGREGRVIGLDFCQEMLDVGEKKVQQRHLGDRIELVRGNAMDIPYPDNTFDYVTIGFGLRNVPDISRVIREMKRVVKPGGLVVSLELSKPTWPPFRALYYFYFYRILPFVGRLAVGKAEPYKWLPESLIEFPDRFALAKLFAEAGLEHIEHYALTGGICALHMGRKPQPALTSS